MMSVVIDRDKHAWQRLGGPFDHEWHRAMRMPSMDSEHPMQWPSLVVLKGPLQMVYSPPK